ncbi:MAG: hypothetical protein R2867_35170 [Caldilineaceae bacterium]
MAWYIWPAVLVVHLLLLQGHRKGYLIALYHAGGLWLAAFILSWRIIVWALAVAVASGWQAVLYTAVAGNSSRAWAVWRAFALAGLNCAPCLPFLGDGTAFTLGLIGSSSVCHFQCW